MSKPPAQTPDLIYVHVGKMIRARRRAIGVSQHDLAPRIGVSLQQVHHRQSREGVGPFD